MLRSGRAALGQKLWAARPACLAPGAPTCVPQLLVPIHGQDDQEVAQDVHHDGEDEDEGQRGGQPRGARPRIPSTVGHLLRGVEERAAIAFQGPARHIPRPPGHRAARAGDPRVWRDPAALPVWLLPTLLHLLPIPSASSQPPCPLHRLLPASLCTCSPSRVTPGVPPAGSSDCPALPHHVPTAPSCGWPGSSRLRSTWARTPEKPWSCFGSSGFLSGTSLQAAWARPLPLMEEP